MSKNDYWKLSAFEGAKLIRDGSISAEDLVSSCIDRVNQKNNKINAIVEFVMENHKVPEFTKKTLEENYVGKIWLQLVALSETILENIFGYHL